MSDQHSSPIKTWQQLVVVVVAAFVVPVIVTATIVALVTTARRAERGSESGRRTHRPVGPCRSPDLACRCRASRSTTRYARRVTARDSQAHRSRRQAVWAKLIAKGEKTVVAHAIQGIRAMPPKGGNPELPDDEVHAAVVHMVNAAGANWKAPPAAPAATATAAAPVPATASVAPVVAVVIPPPTAAAPAGKADGKHVYETACFACHGAGVAGAPKFGDKVAWAPRLTSERTRSTLVAQGPKARCRPREGATASRRSCEGRRRLHDRSGRVRR